MDLYYKTILKQEEIHRNGVKNINELRPIKFTGRVTRGTDERTSQVDPDEHSELIKYYEDIKKAAQIQAAEEAAKKKRYQEPRQRIRTAPTTAARATVTPHTGFIADSDEDIARGEDEDVRPSKRKEKDSDNLLNNLRSLRSRRPKIKAGTRKQIRRIKGKKEKTKKTHKPLKKIYKSTKKNSKK